MAIKVAKNISGFTFLLGILLFGCKTDRSVIEGVPLTGFYDSCAEYYDFGQMIKMGDPGDRFFISLPYSWDIREHYSDTLYGVFASNFMSIPIDTADRMSIVVSGYLTDEKLWNYYISELKQLKKDKKINVKETGSTEISGNDSFWIKFSQQLADQKVYNLVVYLKKEYSDEIYLIQSTVYDTQEYDKKFCYLKQVISSFEIVE